MSQERVLALRALGLGDLLTAAPGWLEPVAMLSGAVDGVLDVRPLGPVPGWPPAVAVNLHGSGPESTERLLELQPGRLWSYDAPDGPDWRDTDHEVERWCRLV